MPSTPSRPKPFYAWCALALGMVWASALVRAAEQPPVTAPVERVRTVEGTLRIEQLGETVLLSFWEKKSIGFATVHLPEQVAIFRALPKEKVLRITLWEQVSAAAYTGDIAESQILKVEDGATLLFDASQCEVHRVTMRQERVRIVYGLMIDPHARIRAAKFPHARDYVSGGCVLEAKTHSLAFLCPECEKAEQTHLKEPGQ